MGGWGWEEKKKEPCGTCQGSGQITVRVTDPNPEPPETKTCPTCNGSGQK
jgi:DnaJ-class molecular chaperone